MKLLAVALVLLLSGCASYGNKIDRDYAAKMVKGETTRQQVISSLGPPMTTTMNSNGETVLHYLHVKSTAKASTFIPIVGAFAGGADTETTQLLITFDDKGLVKDWNYSESASEVNTGLTAN